MTDRDIRVGPHEGHWALEGTSYLDRFVLLMEAVGNLAWELAEDNDPNSPFSHWAIRDRVREIGRQAKAWERDITALVGEK